MERMAAVRTYLAEKRLDALLFTNFYSILYLTGLKTLSPHEREAYLLVTPDHSFIFTDGRYEEQFASVKRFELRILTMGNHILKQIRTLASELTLSSLGFEREDLKWSEYDMLKTTLPVDLVPVDRLMLKVRAQKDKGELAAIEKACAVGDACLSYVQSSIRPGTTERQIAWEMEKWIREQGHALSFEPIVAAGANAAVPHYNTAEGDGTVGDNSLVLIDMGVRYKNYCSDITRIFFTGTPAGEVSRAYESLLSAQEDTVKELSAIDALSSADHFCRSRLEKMGYPTYPHSTGHGVGLEVHEYPKLAAISFDEKKPGQVVTVEPGIYMPGKWGMRIEDTVAIREDGVARALTRFPKKLLVLG